MGNCFSIQLSGGDALINRCWDCIAPRFSYLPELQIHLKELARERDLLRALKDDVKQKVTNQQGPQKKQLDVVRVWVSQVEDKIAEVDRLIIDGENEKNRLCFGGYCSKSCCSSYTLAKTIVETLKDVIDRRKRGNFETVVERVPVEPVVERPSEPTVGLESMLEKVWNSLIEENIGVIGIYVMGGVGKTTLLTEANNRFLKSPHDFDFVIWVVASKDVELDNMQEQIAGQIGLSEDPQWKEKQFSEKATIIFRVLQTKKFILLLDDVWNRVELKDVGVPPPNKQNKSKLVFTTRSEGICGEIEAQRSILLTLFPWRKAWQLFQDKVGREALEADPDIPHLAKDVAKECAGLPLALVTVGRAMARSKTVQEWKHALEILRTSATAFRGMGDRIFPKLKFSYDNLPNGKVKSCLLYCTLFPEDFKIPKEELIQKWVCESFWDDGNGQIDAINEGYSIIATLVLACLLEDKGKWVKMHDEIHDMCLWIACEVEKKKENYFVWAGSQLTKAPDMGKLTEVRRISLMQNNIQRVMEVPETSSLLTLFLFENRKLKVINDGFFKYLKALRVLDLSKTGLTVLPLGIIELASLQYLDISATHIAKLPWELTRLKKLKHFNFESILALKEIPSHMMSSFPLLQILRTRACDFVLDRLVVEEFETLEDLKELSITINRDPSVLLHLLSSHKLSTCTRYLELRYLDSSSSSFSANDQDTPVESRSESFETKTQILGGLHKSLGKICFTSLRNVDFWGCHLLDLTWIILAPNLTQVSVRESGELEEIISYTKLVEVVEVDQFENLNLFARLQVLELEDLPQLKSICCKPLLFSCLNKICVFLCPLPKKLPVTSRIFIYKF